MFPANYVNAKLFLDGEYPVSCPYNQSHTISNSKYLIHLMKCRRNYEIAQFGKKAPLVKVSCKYNFHHQVYPPELLSHEYSCPDKVHNKAFLDFLAVRYNHKLKDISEGTYPKLKDIVEKFQPSATVNKKEDARDDLFKSTYGINLKDLPKSLISVIKDRPTVTAVVGVVPSQTEVMAAKRIANERMTRSRYDPPNGRENRLGIRQRIANKKLTDTIFTIEENDGELEEDSEEYYAPNSSRPTYNYMTSWQKSNAPTFNYPPGLTKRQRKIFMEYNAQRLLTQGGI